MSPVWSDLHYTERIYDCLSVRRPAGSCGFQPDDKHSHSTEYLVTCRPVEHAQFFTITTHSRVFSRGLLSAPATPRARRRCCCVLYVRLWHSLRYVDVTTMPAMCKNTQRSGVAHTQYLLIQQTLLAVVNTDRRALVWFACDTRCWKNAVWLVTITSSRIGILIYIIRHTDLMAIRSDEIKLLKWWPVSLTFTY